MSTRGVRFYEFGPFRLDLRERLLQHGGKTVPLTPKVFDTLLVLVENGGNVLEKEVLMKKLWPDSFVEESSLAQNISLLRKALGTDTSQRQYIQTLPKRGYRFIGDIHAVTDEAAEHSHEQAASGEIITGQKMTEESGTTTKANASPPHRGQARVAKRFGWKTHALIGCAIVMAATCLHFWRWSSINKAGNDVQAKSIAVLPFNTVGTPESETELLGFGMADTLIIKLSNLHRLSVLPSNSVYKYIGREKSALAVGRELGVDVVLDGTVQRSGEHVCVSAQLINIADGRTLWASTFDEVFNNIFEVHDLISTQLAVALMPHLNGNERERLTKRYTTNAAAYEAYLTGLYFWNKRTKPALAKAIIYFEQAIERDPTYALAYAMLSDSYFLSLKNSYHIVPPREAQARHFEAAQRAIELDAGLAEAHMVMASVKYQQGDNEEADREYRYVIELNPNHAIARLRYSFFLLNSLRLNHALEQMRMAQSLDPVSPVANAALGYLLTISRRSDEAIKYCRKALELDPEVIDGHLNLGEAYVQKGMYDEAILEFRKMLKDQTLSALQAIAYTEAMAGRRTAAHKILHSPDASRISDYHLVLIFAALGEHDQAFERLDKLPLNRTNIALLKFDPQLDLLRAEPRFTSYLSNKRLSHLLAGR